MEAEEISREIGNLSHIERMLKSGHNDVALTILQDLIKRKLVQFDNVERRG